MTKTKLPTLEPTAPEVKRGRPTKESKRHNIITRRILELDDDIMTLKIRRDSGYISPAESQQLTRLIKLFERTVKILHEAM